ncbi:hypothetical protein G7Y79_00065g094720 [Physcia stellaris]|nr:hypothetical protein G7Y79_00065g094720 [Physcia stellaris]
MNRCLSRASVSAPVIWAFSSFLAREQTRFDEDQQALWRRGQSPQYPEKEDDSVTSDTSQPDCFPGWYALWPVHYCKHNIVSETDELASRFAAASGTDHYSCGFWSNTAGLRRARNYGAHIDTIGDVFDQLATGYSSWDYLPIDPNAPYPSYGNLNMSSANQYYIPTQYDCFHGQAGYQTTEFMDAHSISQVYQTPTAMEMLPIQYAAHTPSDIGLGYPPKIATKKSRELVGMGLYDDKNGSMDSPVDAMGAQSRNIYTDPNRSSMGKGLKLEETWQPPGSGSTEEAEDYSSDEAEEDLPVAPPSQQTQPQVFSDYKDLSNQSFFFESDDQYSNYLAMEQAMQFCKPKAPDPSSGNFLWL